MLFLALSGGLVALIIFGVLVVLLLLWVAGVYNGLIGAKLGAENAWAQIDVQLKRRYDLIPNLVETVKGYAAHERGTLEAVIKARQQAIDTRGTAGGATPGGVAAQAAAENSLTGALRQLLMVAEAYPDLKANQNFSALQEELGSTENKIGFARQYYNDAATQYNTRLQMFPTNIIGNSFGFQPRQLFLVENAAEREAPKVKF